MLFFSVCLPPGRRKALRDRSDTLGVALGHIWSHLRRGIKPMMTNVLNYTGRRVQVIVSRLKTLP